MASAASPTPAGAEQAAPAAPLTRRTSQRQQALRRPPSRSLRKRESNSSQPANGQQQQQYNAMNDSSDDEMPVPMKLSALTKALLDDGGAPREAQAAQAAQREIANNAPASPPRTRRRSALSSSVSGQQEERRSLRSGSSQPRETRQTRANSSALSPSTRSRENSPVRKRVIRLSTTPKSLSQMKRRSTSQSAQPQPRPSLQRKTSTSRPPSRDKSSSSDVNKAAPAAAAAPAEDVNTPAQQPRVIRITSGSRRSANSSAISSAKSAGLSAPASGSQAEAEAVEDPGTAARQGSSASRPTNGSGRQEDDPALRGSVRVKRVGKVPGSFLSGPARRGRRRQSEEEDGDGNGDGEQVPGSQDRGSQPPDVDNGIGEMPGSSFIAGSKYADFANGSPVSSKDLHRRHASMADMRMSSARPSPGSNEGQPEKAASPALKHHEPEIPSAHDQENELPAILQHSKYAFHVNPVPDQKPRKRLSGEILGANRGTVSPRKPLAAISHNTPHRRAPQPPPKMSVVDVATASAGASTTQAKQRRNIIRVNGKNYTRLDVIGRGGSAKVWRVTAENGKMWAVKRVSLEHADEATVQGFKSEIDLLVKLAKVERVISLLDYEMNEERKLLTLVGSMRLV